ncbi:ATP-dependent RecD-like DNA helicase [bacterium]|nr:ATP-dependent RecD-like DNA helicase [bacterium]
MAKPDTTRYMSEKIEGSVKSIIFRNEESGYTVFTITSNVLFGEKVVVGKFCKLSPGQYLEVEGEWELDSKYGRRFRAESFKIKCPTTVAGILNYLSSGLIKGIGPELAERIVSRFGEETLSVIENCPDRLKEVSGIGEKRIKMIKSALEQEKGVRELFLFLGEKEISTNLALKVYRRFGENSIEVIRNNPYVLPDELWGVGFRTADRIASEFDIPKDSPYRIASGIIYTLKLALEEGNLFLPKKELIERSSVVLELDQEKVAKHLPKLIEDKKLIVEDNRVYLPQYWCYETGLAAYLAGCLTSRRGLFSDVSDEEIASLERSFGISYTDEQKKAIQLAFGEGLLIITGGPGTGKTTLVRGIVEVAKRRGISILLASPTGRAAKRLSEATGMEAFTVHRLLEYNPGKNRFERNKDNLLECDMVLVDEASMLDIEVAYHLLSAIPPGTRLIFVGDSDQLPPVGPGMPFKSVIRSGAFRVVRLRKIFRQEERNLIVLNAHRVIKGKMPIVRNSPKSDFFFIRRRTPADALDYILELISERLPKSLGVSPIDDIQVLTLMHKGVCGAKNMNIFIQKVLNQTEEGIRFRDYFFKTGDKVMQVRNNYEKLVFNGDIGRITQINREESYIKVMFDKPTRYDISELDEIVPAYAITVHKSQGSEYPVVILPLFTEHFLLLQRNILYTAMTRAMRMMIIVGTEEALRLAVANARIMHRNSYLSRRLRLHLRI